MTDRGPGSTPRSHRDLVACRTADDRWLRKLDIGEGGYDFPCRLVVWEDDPDDTPTPWPIEDVKPLDEHPAALTRTEFSRV